MSWNHVVPETIRSIIRSQRPIIRSDRQFVRDYIYVEDGAAACLLARAELSVHTFNFSTENRINAVELVDAIRRAMDSLLIPRIRNEVSGEIREQYLSWTKPRHMLVWKPVCGIEDGEYDSLVRGTIFRSAREQPARKQLVQRGGGEPVISAQQSVHRGRGGRFIIPVPRVEVV